MRQCGPIYAIQAYGQGPVMHDMRVIFIRILAG
jgi:hypothetical protein